MKALLSFAVAAILLTSFFVGVCSVSSMLHNVDQHLQTINVD